MSTTPNYDIDKDTIESTIDADKNTAIAESDKAFDDMVASNNATRDDLLGKIEANTAQQTEIANQNTEFAIQQVEQQKQQTAKDYTKEQSGAYADWKKQSNAYGANAEQMAASGLSNTGYSESSQVAMYNQYQNRVAVARESYQRAVVSYDNAITQARLANSSALAEIAAQALAQSLEITMSFVSQNNTLLSEKLNQRNLIDQNYYNRYLAELEQINKENTLKEQVRQHQDTMAAQAAAQQLERDQWEYAKAENEKNAIINKYTTETEYFKGTVPEATRNDAEKYGTFDNGYQPKGIEGHGALEKSGKTCQFETKTLSGETKTVTQNVWKAEDGTLWYWEGSEMKYKPFKAPTTDSDSGSESDNGYTSSTGQKTTKKGYGGTR